MRLCLVLFVMGFPALGWAQQPDRLAAVRTVLLATKSDIASLHMTIYIADEKLPSDSADPRRESWTAAEIEAFSQSFLPISRRAESDLLKCDSKTGCTHRVAAVVIRIAEPIVDFGTGARVRLIWTWPVGGDLNRTKGTSLLAQLQAREGAWVVAEAVYSVP
jgi:hypothetical protein